jgi:putative transposase
VHFGVHLCVVALGIGIDGTKLPLGLAEGSTESTSVVTDLLTGLRDRGLGTSRAIFVGIDGGKALRAAVVQVFEHPVIARCQLHKIRNVADKLPDHLASTVTKRMRKDYHADSALAAEAQLEALAKELERTHPGAAGSLREGMAETLTVLRVKVPPTLARTLRSANSIESMISIPGHPLEQREELAERHHGAALVRSRDDRSPRSVPARQRTPAPASARAALDAHVPAQTVGAVVRMTT